jgi:hypothetical protein
LVSYHESCLLGLKKEGDQNDKIERETFFATKSFREFIFVAGIFRDYEQLIFNFNSRGIETISIIKL